MIVLGIDTSTSATAAALSMPDGALFERRDDPPAGSHPGHATRLLTMVDGLLADAAIGLADVGRIAVGAGPGTFTGSNTADSTLLVSTLLNAQESEKNPLLREEMERELREARPKPRKPSRLSKQIRKLRPILSE